MKYSLTMITLDDGIKLVHLARDVIESYVKYNKIANTDLGRLFHAEQGVFVTIHTFPDHNLRGCIGIPQPIMPLKEAIIESAKSATRDPRFSPLQKQELDRIVIELTVLTTPELLQVSQPKDYLPQIEIGRDGLIVEQGRFKGLLLPQVPVEHGWDTEEFLSQTCVKAGLFPDAWFDNNTKISKFQGQIFSEVEPGGKIREHVLDGTHN